MLGTSSFQQSSSVICVSNKLASQSSSDHINLKQSHCLQGCWCCSFCFVPLQRANVWIRQRTNPFLSLPFLPSLKWWVRVQFILQTMAEYRLTVLFPPLPRHTECVVNKDKALYQSTTPPQVRAARMCCAAPQQADKPSTQPDKLTLLSSLTTCTSNSSWGPHLLCKGTSSSAAATSSDLPPGNCYLCGFIFLHHKEHFSSSFS